MLGRREKTEWILAWRQSDKTADKLGLPPEWVLCPICGQQSWRFPPHSLDPCPLAIQVAEAQGLKFDAERMTALRTGVNLEQSMQMMQRFIEEQGLFGSPEEDDEA